MTDRVFVWLAGGVGLVVLLVSVQAFRCNLHLLRAARRVAPLDGLDLTAARIEASRAPRHWPVVEDVAEPHIAAAYASLADDYATNLALGGEFLVLAGGAAMGVAIPALTRPYTGALWILAAGVPAFAGLFLRLIASRRWQPVYVRYIDRYAELTAAPVPPRRRGLLSGLFGR